MSSSDNDVEIPSCHSSPLPNPAMADLESSNASTYDGLDHNESSTASTTLPDFLNLEEALELLAPPMSTMLLSQRNRLENMLGSPLSLIKFLAWFGPAALRSLHPDLKSNPPSTRLQPLLVHAGFFIAQDSWCTTLSNDRDGINPTKGKLAEHRLVTETLTKDLTQVMNYKHMIMMLIDTVSALQAASFRCNWVHRDIQPAHIFMDSNKKGVLTDWDIPQHEYGYEVKLEAMRNAKRDRK
ncbi:hypothetical protein H0H93_009779 [Arthromyces matolae]|nr:hypothetical protein H0H93_009779 [Arthromyces matolae]